MSGAPAAGGPVVSFGEALIDFLQEEARGTGPARYTRYAGGAPANVAVAVAKLGGDSAFVGMLARDAFGDFLLEQLRDAGVRLDCVLRTDAARTALAFVSLGADGERRFSFYRPPAADLLFRSEHFPADCFGAGFFHACSNSLTETPIASATLAGMARARGGGALVSFDMNLRPGLWPRNADPRPRIRKALEQADLVKFSSEEFAYLAEAAGGEAALSRALLDGAARLIAVTAGAGPIRYFTRAASGKIDPIAVTAVDTTAAGDAFVGGLLFTLQQQRVTSADFAARVEDPEWLKDALRFAAACGAVTVTRKGAFPALPSLVEVRALPGAPA